MHLEAVQGEVRGLSQNRDRLELQGKVKTFFTSAKVVDLFNSATEEELDAACPLLRNLSYGSSRAFLTAKEEYGKNKNRKQKGGPGAGPGMKNQKKYPLGP